MKPHLDIKHHGNVDDADRVRMTFDENSIAHLMSVLTDLYSDPELAVIREYSTNAYDAHRAAGHDDPIEITLPTLYEPLFTVRDHGIGMTAEEILGQFSKYGFSSKRDTDDEVGMLGLGCKSGLTYTSQFTLVATKNGTRSTVLVTRESDGAGAVQVVHSEATTDFNGVEVQIPVKNALPFATKVRDFFKFWEPGSVLIDGDPATSIWADPERDGAIVLDPDVLLYPKNDGEMPDYIVMGNVAYPIPWSDEAHRLVALDREYPRYGGPRGRVGRAVVRVPIGSVNFTPSRESLHFTKRTEETCADARKFIADLAHRRAQERIDRCATHTQALRQSWEVAHLARRLTQDEREPFIYRGCEIPTQSKVNWPVFVTHTAKDGTITVDEYERVPGIFSWTPSYDNAYRSSSAHWNDLSNPTTLHVVGYPGKALYASAKRKVRKYIEDVLKMKVASMDPSLRVGTVYFYADGDFASPWLDDVRTVPWATIDAVVLPKDTTGTDKKTKWLRIMQGPERYAAVDVPPDDKTLVWLPADSVNHLFQQAIRAVRLYPDLALVTFLKKDAKRFARECPTAQPFAEWLEKTVTDLGNNLTEIERFLLDEQGRPRFGPPQDDLAVDLTNTDEFEPDAIARILDPDMRAVLYVVRGCDRDNNDAMSKYESLRSVGAHFGVKPPPLAANSLRGRVLALQKKYPLLAYLGGYGAAGRRTATVDDFIQYLNDTFLYLTRPYQGEYY